MKVRLKYYQLYIGVLIILLTGCTASREVVPLNWREKTINIDFGGPLTEEDFTPYPVPNLALYYSYGYKKKVTTYVGAFLTPAVEGVYITDWGFLREWKYWKGSKIGITSSQSIQLGYNQWESEFIHHPQLDLNAYWHFWSDPHYHCDCPGDRKLLQFLYLGMSNYWMLSKTDYLELDRPGVYFATPHIGYNLGTRYWKFNLEVKNYIPFTNNEKAVMPIYNPFMDYGAYGVFFSFKYYLLDKDVY